MKTIAKNATLGLAIGGIVVLIVSGIFLHDYTAIKAGAILFVACAALRLGLAASD